MAATWYLPEGAAPASLPAILLLPGYIASQKINLPEASSYFVEHGYAALTVDYRGFGKSGGERWRAICGERVDDARMALGLMAARPEVDPARMGIYGASFGGSIAVAVAAADRRARAIVCVGSPSDGETWLMSQHSYPKWLALRRRAQADELRRCLGEPSERVSFRNVFLPLDDPEGAAFTAQHHAADPDYYDLIPLEALEDTVRFKPVELVERIAPRAVLIVHGSADSRVPLQQALDLYRRAGQPKSLRVLESANHYTVTDPGPRFDEVLHLAREWFDEHLAPIADPYDPTPYL